MTKGDLELIRDIEKNITLKKQELEALRYKASGAGAIRYDKEHVQSSPEDYFVMAIADVVEIEKQIKEAEDNMEKSKGAAYAIIRKMEKPDQRTMLEWYYLNGVSMLEICDRMNLSERTAYYLRDESLEEFESVQ